MIGAVWLTLHDRLTAEMKIVFLGVAMWPAAGLIGEVRQRENLADFFFRRGLLGRAPDRRRPALQAQAMRFAYDGIF